MRRDARADPARHVCPATNAALALTRTGETLVARNHHHKTNGWTDGRTDSRPPTDKNTRVDAPHCNARYSLVRSDHLRVLYFAVLRHVAPRALPLCRHGVCVIVCSHLLGRHWHCERDSHFKSSSELGRIVKGCGEPLFARVWMDGALRAVPAGAPFLVACLQRCEVRTCVIMSLPCVCRRRYARSLVWCLLAWTSPIAR